MNRFRISKSAQVDLIKIAQYGDENYGLERSNQYRDGLKNQFEVLSESPKLYRERWELSPPIRVCPYESHVIIYTIEQGQTVIVRVRHRREDWK